MRIYQITLFAFLFVLSLSIISETGIFTPYGIGISSMNINNKNAVDFSSGYVDTSGNVVSSATEGSVDTQQTFSWFNAVYQFVFVGIPKFIGIIFYTTLGIPILLQGLGMPSGMAWLLSGAIWFIYAVGILQFIMDRDVSKYQ
jgi:hypothetical protein